MFWKGLNCWQSGVLLISSCNRLGGGDSQRKVVQEKSDHYHKVKKRKGV